MNKTSIDDVDFSPIKKSSGLTRRVIRGEWQKIIDHPQFWRYLPLAVFAGVIIFLLSGLILLLGLVSWYLFILVKTKKKQIWLDFAKANQWEVRNADDFALDLLPHSLALYERVDTYSPVIRAEFEGHNIDIYGIQFFFGPGKGRHKYSYTIARLHLPKPFPHMALDNRRITHPDWILGKELVSTMLEGNFNESFVLMHEKGKHVEALSVITPDVMVTILDRNLLQEIEIYKDNMYFISSQDRYNHQELRELFFSIDAFADEIMHKSRTL